jgi:epsilon-lactone hydrolase
VDDVLACCRRLGEIGIHRIAVTGDSAGGNLALALAARVVGDGVSVQAALVGVAALSPITDLTLAGVTYQTLAGLPPIRIHAGDEEVLLDDSRRYVEYAKAAGVDARLDVWMGMPHGSVGSVGTLKAVGRALDAVAVFLAEMLEEGARP